MPRCRFVMPDVTRIPMSEGHWIDVKKELNIGERKRLEACGIRRTTMAPPVVDWEEYHIGRAAIWLVDWSYKSPDGKDVEISVAAIRSLDEETFAEIQDALSKHVEELDVLKKARASTTKDSQLVGASTEVTSQ